MKCDIFTDDYSPRFLWVQCQLDSLRRCKTPNQVASALRSLPKDIHSTYDRILCAIPDDEFDMAHTILQWLIMGRRPLSVIELAETLVIDLSSEDEAPLNPGNLPWDPMSIFSQFSSLLIVTHDSEQESIVRLSHASVKDYLLSEKASRFRIIPREAHRRMAISCMAYLSQSDVPDSVTAVPERLDQSTHGDLPVLWEYSASFWTEHLQAEEMNGFEVAQRLIKNIFWPPDDRFWLWQPIWAEHTARRRQLPPLPLHCAAYIGLPLIVEWLLEDGADPQQRPQQRGPFEDDCTALSLAAEGGYLETANVLLRHGADINLGNVLAAAAQRGHLQLADMLLKNGADVNKGCPLSAAVARGHNAVVALLLGHGAEVNVQDKLGNTPLSLAAVTGYFDIAALLLEHGADVNLPARFRRTPLAEVVIGFPNELQNVFQGGLVGNGMRPALLVAARLGRSDAMADLLHGSARTSINKHMPCPVTPHLSVGSEHLKIIKLLLERGANVDLRDGYGYTPLSEAARQGRSDLLAFLLESAHCLRLDDAVLEAARGGFPNILALLAKHGANLNCIALDGRHPLIEAAFSDHVEVVAFLLDHGIAADCTGRMSIEGASMLTTSQYDLMQLLYEDVSPLQVAVALGNIATVQILLDKGANPHGHTTVESPLELARHGKQEDMVCLLENYGRRLRGYTARRRKSALWKVLEGSRGSEEPGIIVTGDAREDLLLEEGSDSEGDSEGNAEWGDICMIDEHETKELAELCRKLVVLE
jgi:ankyrin repeat protein